jgi:hypothetical protein
VLTRADFNVRLIIDALVQSHAANSQFARSILFARAVTSMAVILPRDPRGDGRSGDTRGRIDGTPLGEGLAAART